MPVWKEVQRSSWIDQTQITNIEMW